MGSSHKIHVNSITKEEENTSFPHLDVSSYQGFTSFMEAVQNSLFNSFHVLGEYRELQQDEQNAAMKEDDALEDTWKQKRNR